MRSDFLNMTAFGVERLRLLIFLSQGAFTNAMAVLLVILVQHFLAMSPQPERFLSPSGLFTAWAP